MKIYSNSELQSYKNCPLSWRFYWNLGLRPIEGESDHHLRFGDAIHKGLEQLYRGATWTVIREAFESAYPVQLDVNDHAKTRANGVVALADYVKRYRGEDKRQWKVLAIETRSDDPWSVKPDLIVENIEHGGVYVVDHKTTGAYLNYRYWERYQPNSQIAHYLDYAQSKYGPIEGFIINAISFRFRERAYKGEPAGFWSAFERQTFNRRPEQLEYERLSRADWIADLERSRDNNFYRTNTDACWKCSYKAICAPGWTWESDRELIELSYRQACGIECDGGYCVLNRNHDEPHSPVMAAESEFVVQVEV